MNHSNMEFLLILQPPPRGSGNKRGSQQRNRGPPSMQGHQKEIKVINIEREKAELHKTDNAWTPSHKKKTSDIDEEKAGDEVLLLLIVCHNVQLQGQASQLLITSLETCRNMPWSD